MQVRPVNTWRTWDPFTALARLDREVDEVVRRAGAAAATRGDQDRSAAMFVPPVEVLRDGEDVVVRFELPGVAVDDLTIEVERGRLVVAGERRDPHEAAEGVLVRELRYGSFRREFALPQGTSPEQVEASYDAGMLDVRVRAVVRPAQEPVRVPVTLGGSRREPAVLEHEHASGSVESASDADREGEPA